MRRHPRDVVVTVPARLWEDWLSEGGLPGDPDTGVNFYFSLGNRKPNIDPGMRVYVVAHGKLRGYAPLVKVAFYFALHEERYALVRAGGAVAVTLPCCPGDPCGDPLPIRGFRGFRYRWWERSIERPFPDWREP